MSDLPGWTRRKRAIWETREFDGRRVQHVIGWEGVRSACGCMWVGGLRLDKQEPTFGAIPCVEHAVYVWRAYDALVHMPPDKREIGELFEELFERELAPA